MAATLQQLGSPDVAQQFRERIDRGPNEGREMAVLALRRNAASAKRAAQGRNSGTRRKGMCSGPSKAVSRRQKPNNSPGDGSGSSSSVAICPALPKLAPASPGASRSMSSTRRPSRASTQATAEPMTPAPMMAIVSCCAIRLTYANCAVRKRLAMKEIRVIDSHTAGEPTRLVLEGGPPLGPGPLDARAARFRAEFDAWRSAIVNEPRGSDAMVGALLCAPHRADCRFGVIFFNNVGVLGMCGHGTIGLIASLAYLRQNSRPATSASTRRWARWTRRCAPMVPSSWTTCLATAAARDVVLDVPDVGTVTGDIAWGGNWFFLVREHGLDIDMRNLEALTEFAWRVRQAVECPGTSRRRSRRVVRQAGARRRPQPQLRVVPRQGLRPVTLRHGHQRQARLPGRGWCSSKRARSGSRRASSAARSAARYRWLDRAAGRILPTLIGRAHVNAQATLLLDPADPFCWGIR